MVLIKRKKIYFAIFWVLLITSFVFFAVILVAFANGYHLNLKTLHLQKTGMIIIDGPVLSSTISINGKDRIGKLPQKFGRLVPGRYEIIISKENYQNWSKVVYLNGNQAITYDNVVLFLNAPTISKSLASFQTVDNVNKNFQSQKTDISLAGEEIRYQNNLITRFSQKILGAVYDSETNHFYLQLGNEIRAINFDGSNNVLLFKLPNSNQVAFYINNENVFYVEGNQLYQVRVR